MISQLLERPRDLFSFLLTSRQTMHSLSKAQRDTAKHWAAFLAPFDQFFKNYNWITDVERHNLTPVLIYRNEAKSYADLVLLDNGTTTVADEHCRKDMLRQIRNSLRTRKRGFLPNEFNFDQVCLNLSGVLSARRIRVNDFKWLSVADLQLEVVVYGNAHVLIRPHRHLYWNIAELKIPISDNGGSRVCYIAAAPSLTERELDKRLVKRGL